MEYKDKFLITQFINLILFAVIMVLVAFSRTVDKTTVSSIIVSIIAVSVTILYLLTLLLALGYYHKKESEKENAIKGQ